MLVVATPRDDHARAVLAVLARRRVPAAVFDVGRFPERAAVALALEGARWQGTLRDARGDAFGPGDLRAVWWRRADAYALDPTLEGAVGDGAYCAAESALRAFWGATDALWVNQPDREYGADEKPAQLALAARLGLAVPRSLVTNDPGAARAFVLERADGETIHKNVTSARSLWRPTAVARRGDRRLFESVRHVPLLFQERVDGPADVRVTIAGERLFATEIDFPRGARPLDHRIAIRRARVRAVRLPRDVDARLRRLTSALGLAYAAIDLRRRRDGEHVFLEVNPSGGWRFVEARTGQRITVAVADLLSARSTR